MKGPLPPQKKIGSKVKRKELLRFCPDFKENIGLYKRNSYNSKIPCILFNQRIHNRFQISKLIASILRQFNPIYHCVIHLSFNPRSMSRPFKRSLTFRQSSKISYFTSPIHDLTKTSSLNLSFQRHFERRTNEGAPHYVI